MNKEIIIRNTKKTDFRVVENLIRDCFFNVYQPGCLEHYVIKNLRESEDYIEELDFVIEKNGQIIGQNIFAKAELILQMVPYIQSLLWGQFVLTELFKTMAMERCLLNMVWKRLENSDIRLFVLKETSDFTKSADLIMPIRKTFLITIFQKISSVIF